MNDQDIKPSVAIIMGSQSDWETMKFSEEILIKLNIPFTTKIIFLSEFLIRLRLIGV